MSDDARPLNDEWAALRNGLSKAYVAADIDAALAAARPRIEAATLDAARSPEPGLREALRKVLPQHFVTRALTDEHWTAIAGEMVATLAAARSPEPWGDPEAWYEAFATLTGSEAATPAGRLQMFREFNEAYLFAWGRRMMTAAATAPEEPVRVHPSTMSAAALDAGADGEIATAPEEH